MNLSFPASYLQAKLNAELPPPHDMTLDERAAKPGRPNGTSASPRAT